jgi:hypothetical protein
MLHIRSVGLFWSFVVCATVTCAVQADSPAPIYACELHGQRVFSDRPCDGSAQAVAMSPPQVNVYEHPKYERQRVTSATSKRSRARTAERSARPDEEDKTRAACARINQSIDAIHSKQRAGYRAKEGVRLDERLRRLEEERRGSRCR